MKKFKDLIKSPYYWIEIIQNELFRQLSDYMEKKKRNQNDVAREMKVSKSYVSQILNGHFNFTLKKLIELSLYMDKVPVIKFVKVNEYITDFKDTEKVDIHTAANRNIIPITATLSQPQITKVDKRLSQSSYAYTSIASNECSVNLQINLN